jgi:hypothetical protein
MGNRSGWCVVVLAMAMVGGCQTATIQRPGEARRLTGFEMDEVTAGSAVAANDTGARALGLVPRTAVLGTASAYSGNSPVAGAPFLNYANSQAIASASNGDLAQTTLSSHVSVDSVNGGASIGAEAAGTGTSRAEVTAEFYGISTNRADIVFGSLAAVGCCGSGTGAQIEVVSGTGGPYSKELRASPVSDTPGQLQGRVDIAVVSSALPILDPAQVLVAGSPTRASPKY